jgi:tritrans,polycis-undecaprenyl-diphosphate synthase [geranylgeranyl-diphosphate specific]
MDLLEKKFREVMVDDRISKYRVRVRAIGDLNRLPKRVRAAIKEGKGLRRGTMVILSTSQLAIGARVSLPQPCERYANRSSAAN